MKRLLLVFAVSCIDPHTGRDLTATFEQIVHGRAAIELDCDAKDVIVEDLGGDAFRAEGCGFRATYECFADINSGDTKTDWRYRCERARVQDPEPIDSGRQ
jgi:hypothetical protein